MSHNLKIFISVVVLSFLFSQAVAQVNPGKYSFDQDLYMLRHNVAPSFHHSYDDYIQYAPGVVLLGLKVCGYHGENEWGRMLAADAISVATMAALVKGLKYTVKRARPDGSSCNSFPSGHSAAAFMAASLLHLEYRSRSPWFGIGAYALAALTGVSRVLNNKHWMTDVLAGAAIGVGSAHLGYFITDKIFKDKCIRSGYEAPEYFYDPKLKHYEVEMLMGRRFVLGSSDMKYEGILPKRGSVVGLQAHVPVIPNVGICMRGTAGNLVYESPLERNDRSSSVYSLNAGGYWSIHFAKVLEFQTRVLIGWARMDGTGGFDVGAGLSLNLITGNNFKIKVIGESDSVLFPDGKKAMNSLLAGFSAGIYW